MKSVVGLVLSCSHLWSFSLEYTLAFQVSKGHMWLQATTAMNGGTEDLVPYFCLLVKCSMTHMGTLPPIRHSAFFRSQSGPPFCKVAECSERMLPPWTYLSMCGQWLQQQSKEKQHHLEPSHGRKLEEQTNIVTEVSSAETQEGKSSHLGYMPSACNSQGHSQFNGSHYMVQIEWQRNTLISKRDMDWRPWWLPLPLHVQWLGNS